MSGPDYQYDMLDMETTDYKTEFNIVWKQWRECKKERNELRAVVEKLQEERQHETDLHKQDDCQSHS